ncbi:MAG: hypothetical protein Q8K27_00995 [Betaproteobacteria bacterium]|jgi:hypothetical protein|nr:hypothetical protein [Betaproteobacteria bacterium]
MNRSTIFITGIITALACAHNAAGESVTRTPVSGIKPLLIRAIKQGTAHGVLIGDAAAYIRQKFDANTPIEIDVRTLHALPQPGCSRLEVTTRQQDVLQHTQRSEKALTYQVSYCRDGHFPDKR